MALRRVELVHKSSKQRKQHTPVRSHTQDENPATIKRATRTVLSSDCACAEGKQIRVRRAVEVRMTFPAAAC